MSRTQYKYMNKDRLGDVPKISMELHPIPAYTSCHQTRVTVILQDKDQVGSTSSAPCMLTGLALQLVSSFKTPPGLIPRTIAPFPAFSLGRPGGIESPLNVYAWDILPKGVASK